SAPAPEPASQPPGARDSIAWLPDTPGSLLPDAGSWSMPRQGWSELPRIPVSGAALPDSAELLRPVFPRVPEQRPERYGHPRIAADFVALRNSAVSPQPLFPGARKRLLGCNAPRPTWA